MGQRETDDREEGGGTGPGAGTVDDAERVRIVVVDDDAATRELMRRLLSPHFDVVLVSSGNGLRKILRGTGPERTVVLMDLDLGSGSENGIDLAGQVRADRRWGGVPILAVSAHVDPHVRSVAFRIGCDGFHEKPVRARLLVTEILEVAGAGERAGTGTDP